MLCGWLGRLGGWLAGSRSCLAWVWLADVKADVLDMLGKADEEVALAVAG